MSIYRPFSRRFLGCVISACLAHAASANNVEALLEGSLLKVNGDNAGNSIVISRTNLGDVVVTGRSGTLVNGLPSVRFPRLQLNAAEVRMEGGNDFVSLRGVVTANDLYVSLGAGSNRLNTTAPVTVGANLTVEGGEATDSIQLTDLTAVEDIYLDGGLGLTTVTLIQVDAGKSMTIISDAAADKVTVSNSTVAEMLSIESKAGNNVIKVSGIMAFATFIGSDLGNDSVTVESLMIADDLGIFTGGGNDSVDLDGVDSSKSITVSVDAGSDMVSGSAVNATQDLVFEGGAGTDTFIDLGVAGGAKKEIKEFEILLP